MARIEIPCGRRYASRGFRRGAAQELKDRGPQWSAIGDLGAWGPLAFLGYVDLTQDVEWDMALLLVETGGIESGDEVQRRVKGPPMNEKAILHWASGTR